MSPRSHDRATLSAWCFSPRIILVRRRGDAGNAPLSSRHKKNWGRKGRSHGVHFFDASCVQAAGTCVCLCACLSFSFLGFAMAGISLCLSQFCVKKIATADSTRRRGEGSPVYGGVLCARRTPAETPFWPPFGPLHVSAPSWGTGGVRTLVAALHPHQHRRTHRQCWGLVAASVPPRLWGTRACGGG